MKFRNSFLLVLSIFLVCILTSAKKTKAQTISCSAIAEPGTTPLTATVTLTVPEYKNFYLEDNLCSLVVRCYYKKDGVWMGVVNIDPTFGYASNKASFTLTLPVSGSYELAVNIIGNSPKSPDPWIGRSDVKVTI